jgi:hypothetical protein
MSGNHESGVPTGEEEPAELTDVESLGELLIAVLWDGVIGAIAGTAGNVVILGTILLASLAGGFDFDSFATVAEILNLDIVLSADETLWAGVVIFVGGGMTTLPLLLATLGAYLPGRNYAEKGLVFGGVMWTGFVLAYYAGYGGVALAVYVVATFLGHLGYGYVTGWMMDRLFAEEGRPVLAASVTSPAAMTEASADPDGNVPREETTLVDDVVEEPDESGN